MDHTRIIKAATKYLSEIGSRGGSTTGKTKKRGNKAHYQRLSKLAVAARKKKRASP